jgi:hypothetical protein
MPRQLFERENVVTVEELDEYTIAGKWSIACHLSQEVRDYMPLVSRRPGLVKDIIAAWTTIFMSSLFRRIPMVFITFTERGPRFELDWLQGGCLYPDYRNNGDYRCGNIDRPDEAYFLYICLQQTIHLIEADIALTEKEGMKLSDKPVDPLTYTLKRPNKEEKST